MTSTPPVGEPEREWQQPPFQPSEQPGAGDQSALPYPVVVPRQPVRPPSAVETVVVSLAGVVWPVMILLAVFGRIGFFPAIVVAIIASTVLGNIRGYLRSRRRALPPAPPPVDDGRDLR